MVKLLLRDMRVNLGFTLPKTNADNERDIVNNEKYPEDKIMVLTMAYEARDPAMLSYLLDECQCFWPSKRTVSHLLEDKIGEEILQY